MKHILTRPSRTIASVVGLRPGKRTFTSAHVRRPIVERLEDRRLLTTYFYESFESELGPEWTLVSVDAEARVAVRDLVAEEIVTNPISVEFSSGANSKALAFDSTQASGDSIKDLGLAILAVDLTGMTGGIMHFQHFKIGGSHDPLPDVHSTTAPGDGVSASRDGSTWYRLRTLTGNDLNRTGDGLWQVFKIDLGAEFQRINQQHQAGLQFDSQVQFKFSQYDSQPLPAQGWAIDEIRIQDQADSFTLDRPRGAFHRFVLSTEEERDYYYRAAVYGSPGPTTPILVTVHGTHGDIAYDGHPWRWQRFLGDRDEEIGSLIVVAPAFVETALLANGAVETLTISRDEGDIAYAITSGVQGRSVRLDHLQFTSLLSATSDAEGGFRVLGIPAGEYLVRLSLEDHEEGTLGPGQDDPTAIGPGVVMANVDFGLVAVDGEPPTVVSLIPSHGALEVAPDIELQIILSEPVQKGSGSIVVRTLADDSVVEVIDVSSPAVTVFQETATILPGSLLALNTAYYVEIGAGAFTDLAGNGWDGFSGREAWIFATTIGSPPELVHTIADVTAAEDDPDTVIGLGPVFDDPDLPWGDQLTYTATVTMPIDSLVAQVSQSNYTAMHQNLLYTRLGDNRGFGPEHDLAQVNIYTYFVGLGLETALEPVPYQAQTYYNVVGVHAGVTRPGDVYLVGAHYDSVNNPGADDNGSGVAAVMELARVMTQYQFDATLVFVAFDREEQGLHGAYAYTAAHDTSKIQGMLSLDMIAYNPPGTHHNKVRFYDSNGVGQIKFSGCKSPPEAGHPVT